MIENKKQPVNIDIVSLSPKLRKKNIDKSENAVLKAELISITTILSSLS